MGMSNHETRSAHFRLGVFTAFSVFVVGIIYAIVTVMGLLSLTSANEVIPNPYFTIMEILTIVISVLMLASMAAVYRYTPVPVRMYGLLSLIFLSVMTGITSCVHFVVLTVASHAEVQQLPAFRYLFSFRWPSVVYALDILAWDFFFPLSMLFLWPVFDGSRYQRILKVFLLISGLLSLAGLIGVPLQNMQVRNIGIIGYAIAGPIVFLLIGFALRENKLQQGE